ncbi:acyl carrier protein [Micromonospora sp. WMMD882]|uniref:acyl carrier protein n=1 Tax=Micromonospora sp. WMMD882 TaxID=3015151 RepID=UPI00248AFA5F|nr:acyl carrier protein [Micromonospora sp. WMMD882]WBB77652.1 acyl carrier protein [Micromonospora sp. WMMD882]
MSETQAKVLADITKMIQAVLGDFVADQEITMDTTFRDELGMESIDVVSLAGRLQTRYGDSVNFAHFVAKLDLETVGDLTVGQLVTHIADAVDAKASGPVEVAAR